jgi:SAM-dependent methyltransferase
MNHSHPSSRPAGHGITIGTPRVYNLSAALSFGGLRRRAYRTLLAAGHVQRGDRVLDVGSGPGYFARMLAEAVGAEGSVVGIDAAPEMTDYASRRARRLSNCRFEPGTAESLAFPDAAFDVVVSSLMIHHLPDEFRIPERCAWRLVASLTGHGKMQRRVPAVEPLVAEAGFSELRSGDAPPWLYYVAATNPLLDARTP